MSARVLLVEDEALLVRVIRRAIVRGFDVEIDEAGDGQVGLECALAHAYDLILSDIRMPQMDGVTMLEHIRDREGPNRATPVLFVTGHHDEGKEAAHRLGARFLGKPFSRQLLVEIVAQLLSAGAIAAGPADA